MSGVRTPYQYALAMLEMHAKVSANTIAEGHSFCRGVWDGALLVYVQHIWRTHDMTKQPGGYLSRYFMATTQDGGDSFGPMLSLDLIKPSRHSVQSFIPSSAFPSAFTSLPDSLQWIDDSVRVVYQFQTSISLYLRKTHCVFNTDEPAVLNMAKYSALHMTMLAKCLNRPGVHLIVPLFHEWQIGTNL